MASKTGQAVVLLVPYISQRILLNKKLPHSYSIFFYFKYHVNTILKFINNKFIVASSEFDIFQYKADGIDKLENWEISRNCLDYKSTASVPEGKYIKLTYGCPSEGEGGDGVGEGGGDEVDEECPEDAGEYEDSLIYTYMCSDQFEESPGIDATNTILAFFHIEFNGINVDPK